MPPRADDLAILGSQSIDTVQLDTITEGKAENVSATDDSSKLQDEEMVIEMNEMDETPALETQASGSSIYTNVEVIQSIACFDMEFLGSMFGGERGNCPHCAQGVLYSQNYVENEYGEFLHFACNQDVKQLERVKMQQQASEQARLAQEQKLKLEEEEKARLALEQSEQSKKAPAPRAHKKRFLASFFGHCKGEETAAVSPRSNKRAAFNPRRNKKMEEAVQEEK